MPLHIEAKTAEPGAYTALMGFYKYVGATGIDPTLRHLIDVRASQINGCAYCIDMHTQEARRAGEAEHRLYALSAWRETPFFTAAERVVLALTEHVTRIADGGVPSFLEVEMPVAVSPTRRSPNSSWRSSTSTPGTAWGSPPECSRPHDDRILHDPSNRGVMEDSVGFSVQSLLATRPMPLSPPPRSASPPQPGGRGRGRGWTFSSVVLAPIRLRRNAPGRG